MGHRPAAHAGGPMSVVGRRLTRIKTRIRVEHTAHRARILAIGVKGGNRLYVGGEELER